MPAEERAKTQTAYWSCTQLFPCTQKRAGTEYPGHCSTVGKNPKFWIRVVLLIYPSLLRQDAVKGLLPSKEHTVR